MNQALSGLCVLLTDPSLGGGIRAGIGVGAEVVVVGGSLGRKRLTGDSGLYGSSAQLPSGVASLLHLSKKGMIRTCFVGVHEDENELMLIYIHA